MLSVFQHTTRMPVGVAISGMEPSCAMACRM